jgi:murein DD-endopeptidase MepM/ murein hydrolase activator NlpD
LNVSNETRAALWQILDNQLYSTDPKHNTAWKAGRNPYSSSVGAQVVEACIEGKSALAASKETDETESAYTSPVSGDIVINSEYGYRIHPISGQWKMHDGLDIDGKQGDPVFAAAEGTVVKTVHSDTGYGNHVIIEHADGTQTLYGHMYSYGVEVGQTVSQGEQIGEVGSTGGSTGPHLHFEVRVDGQAVNPQTIFDFTGEGIVTESDPNYTPIVSGGGSSGGGGGGSSRSSASTSSPGSRTSQVASNHRSGGIYLPTASGSSVGRSGRSSSVAGMSTSTPTYGTRGVYLPKASDYTSGGSSIRSSVATTQRTGRTGGSFWNG